jgi:ATP-binding cassette, subfamily B, multidrug efflux pump
MILNPFKPFGRYLRPHWKRISLGLSLLTVAQLVSTAVPLALQEAVDIAKAGYEATQGLVEPLATRTGSAAGDVGFYAAVIVGLALLQMFLSMIMRWCLNSTSRMIDADIRQVYFYHLLTLSLSFFHRNRVGDLMARATNDVQAVRMFLGFGIRMLFEALLAFAFSLIVMCSIDWQLALWSLLPMPLLSIIMRQVAGKVHVGFRAVQEAFSTISARVQENLAGVRVVKAYVQREPEIDNFRTLNRDYVDKNRRLIHIQSLFFPLTFLLGGASLCIILWLGGQRVISGQLTLGQFVAFNAYLTKLIFPMITLGWMVDRYQRGLASMRRIDEILEQHPEIGDAAHVEEEAQIRGDIEFRNLSFAYGDDEVLHNIDLRVPAGSTLAVVGRVGSGKTTLARLIPRLIQPTSGQLLIDGVPIEQLPLQTLRSSIGFVPQDSFLFSDTMRDNVALGVETVDEGQVESAVEIAQLTSELDSLSDGLETMIGERGVTLSGGQKQRAALARAIIRHPRILILDDAMASVDTYTEEEILRGLRQVMAERTTVLIAHRISTVREADQIIVLDEGRIAEQGSHAQLVELDGIYADMHRRQSITQQLSEI